MHTASPVTHTAGEPDEIIRPAVKGTTSLLNSVVAHGSSVRRIVYTSAVAAVFSLSNPKVWDEADWNDDAVRVCEEQGRNAFPMLKYCASKVLSERAAWDIFEKHKASSSWDLVTIIPPYVFGPILHAASGLDALNGSMQEWYDLVFGVKKIEDQPSDGYVAFINAVITKQSMILNEITSDFVG